MRKLGFVIGVLIGVAVFEQPSSAQSFTYAVFGQTLDSLRQEAAIPGMSAALVQDGIVVWSSGMGRQDLEGAVAARPDTPYVIGALSQTMGSTLLLRKCMDQSYAELTDRVVRWAPDYADLSTTLVELLSHTTSDGAFHYDPARFAGLTEVVKECATERYPLLLAEEIFEPLAMTNSAPGQTLASPSAGELSVFGAARLSRYADILRQLAVPYRIISRRPARNTEVVATGVDAANGIVSSVLDLARFDAALDNGRLLAPDTRLQALTQVFAGGRPQPTGLGWFVQAYNGEPIAWQFGLVENAYSSLIVKIPNRHLTLILLANSDGLSAPFGLAAGDVTTSIFAKTFLRTFVP